MDDAKWYVIHTYSGYESMVAANLKTIVENRGLQDWIRDVSVPTETVVEMKDSKKREVERKIFPGYVLVKMVMNDDSWYVVRNIRGCTGFVGPNGKPVPLTEEEVASLGVDKREVEIRYKVGDMVRIIDGPLENFTGRVDEIDLEKNSIKVTTSMFGRDTPVELRPDEAELLDD